MLKLFIDLKDNQKRSIMEQSTVHIGHKVKKLRELKNFTQNHMAQELGITQSAYSKMEMGESEITFHKLERISEILGISLEDIASFNEQMIFNVMHNQTGNGFVVNKGISEQERKLYEDQIRLLQEQNDYLKRMLEKVLEK
jgi:transcriptional regulator with XRE-family HTH domain